MRATRRLLLLALPAALLGAIVATAFWSAQRTLTRSAAIAQTQQRIGFTLTNLDPAAAGPTHFDAVAARTDFTSGTVLDGEFYLAGPAGLSVYSAEGVLLHRLRTGLELPVAPIVAVASGRLRGTSSAQVLLATAGDGLLMLEPQPNRPPRIRHLLPDSAQARDLTALEPMPSGDLILGTRHGGVLVFSGTTLLPLTLAGAPADLQVTSLASADASSLLIGTRSAGVFYHHAGATQHAGASEGLPDDQVEAIAVSDGHAYIGTPVGVAEIDLGSGGAFRPARTLARATFTHALGSQPNQLWIGSLDQGAQSLALDARPHLRAASLPISTSSASAEIGRFDQFLPTPGVLFALKDGALVRRSTSAWVPVLPPQPGLLTDRNISALAFAPDGTLYVGFFDHGIDILPATGNDARHFEDDRLFCINRLMLDPRRQTIAAATANGLVLFDMQHTPHQTLTRRDGLLSDHITDIAFTRTGMSLATPAGITTIGPSGTESLYAFQGLVNNHVYTLGAAPDSTRTGTDQLLAGTLGGLSLLEAGSVRRNFTAANSTLKHNWITALAPLPLGAWLVGTYGAGITTLTPHPDGSATFSPIALPTGAPRDLVVNPNALLVTPTHIYAGTLGHGLLVLSKSTGLWAQVERGLPSLNITAFAARNGQLYIGTDNGLVRIAEDAFSEGRP